MSNISVEYIDTWKLTTLFGHTVEGTIHWKPKCADISFGSTYRHIWTMVLILDGKDMCARKEESLLFDLFKACYLTEISY